MNADGTRIELLETLQGLESEASALRAKRAIITHRLGQLLHEEERVRTHLARLENRGEEEEAC